MLVTETNGDPRELGFLRGVVRLLRPHHWLKNVFVVAPLVFSMRLFEAEAIVATALAVGFFCLLSSAVYVVNDIADRKRDQIAPRKAHRPLVSGAVSLPVAWTLSVVLLIAAAALIVASPASRPLAVLGAVYLGINLGYSLGLKHVPLLELFIVASGYIIRLLVGSAVVQQTPSHWILVATGTVALLLVTGKRRADLIAIERDGLDTGQRPVLEHYSHGFLSQIITISASTTIVTYLLFVISDYAIARYGDMIVTSGIFVAFGVLRYVQITQSDSGADSPTTLVMSDGPLRTVILLWAFFIMAVAYG